jgi:hypothetical protein
LIWSFVRIAGRSGGVAELATFSDDQPKNENRRQLHAAG